MPKYRKNNYDEHVNDPTKNCDEDLADFRDEFCPSTNDINYLYTFTLQNVLDTSQSNYSKSRFHGDLTSAMTHLFMKIKRRLPDSTEFTKTVYIPILPEDTVDDHESGRNFTFLIPKDCAQIISVELAPNMDDYYPLKPATMADFRADKCGRSSSRALDAVCNKNLPCFECKDVYIKQNGCIRLPYRLCGSGMLMITYYQSPAIINDDTVRLDLPPVWFNVLAYWCAMRYHGRRDGENYGGYAEVSSMYNDFLDELLEHYGIGDIDTEEISFYE